MRRKFIPLFLWLMCAYVNFVFARAWTEHRPQNCRCQVSVPKSPEYSLKDVPSDVGTLKMHQFMMDYGDYAFLLTYTDYPATLLESKTAEKILEDVVKGSTSDGQLIRKIDLEIDDFPGKEYVAKKTDFTLKGRVFLVGPRLYQLIAVYPPSQADALGSDVEEFLRSFRLLH